MGVQQDWGDLSRDRFLRKYAPMAEFILLFLLAAVALFFPSAVSLTWQAIALIVIIVIIPYIPLIKRISYGEWEAELETLVESAERTVEDSNTTQDSPDVGDRIENLESMLTRQLGEDRKVALAKLRMEMEEVLRTFAEDREPEHDSQHWSFSEVLWLLKDENSVMDKNLYKDTQKVWDVTTRAIHGDEISTSTAKRIVDLGLQVLERIYYETNRPVNPDPSMPVFTDPETEEANDTIRN